MEIDLYDIDPTEHTIEINLNIEEAEIVAGVINPDGKLGEYDSYFVENGIALVPALSTAMFFRCYAPAPYYPLFYYITYNKSISSAFEEAKNQAQTAISGVKMLDEKITNQISKNAGALKGTKSGVGSVVIDDIDNMEHIIKISADNVTKENIIAFPYNKFNGQIGSISATIDEDGTIRVKGYGEVDQENEYVNTPITSMLLPVGTYTLSGEYDELATGLFVQTAKGENVLVDGHFTLEEETEINIGVTTLFLDSTIKHECNIRLMLSLGKDKQKWISPTPLSVHGSNLLELDATRLSGYVGCEILPNNSIKCDIQDYYYAGISVTYLNGLLQALDGHDLTFSIKEGNEGYMMSIVVFYTNGEFVQKNSGRGERTCTITLDHKGRTVDYIHVRPQATVGDRFTDTDTIIEEIQLEIGKIASPFEKPKTTKRYSMALGVTEYEVKSFHPVTTIVIEDSEIVNIEVKYNKAIEKCVKEYAYSRQDTDEKLREYASKKETNNIFAEALKRSVSSTTAIAIKNDVSKVEHDINLQMTTNAIPLLPYTIEENRIGGIPYTIEDDTIILSGMCNNDGFDDPLSMQTSIKSIVLSPGTYTFRHTENGNDINDGVYMVALWDENGMAYYDTFTIDTEKKLNLIIGTITQTGKSYNITLKPMLSKGAELSPSLAGATLKVYGGNLLNLYNDKISIDGTVLSPNSFKASKSKCQFDVNSAFREMIRILDGHTLTLSRKPLSAHRGMQIVIMYSDGTSTIGSGKSGDNYISLVLNHNGRNIQRILFRPMWGDTFPDDTHIIEDIQIEIDGVSEFMPYIEPTEYKVGDSVKSVHPSTTLICDAEGVKMEAEYNRDINKAFEEMYNAIISLGGNI